VETLIYVLWGESGADAGDQLRGRLLGEKVTQLRASGAWVIGVNVHDSDAAGAPSPAPPPRGRIPT
jgi:hypothetical protein